MKYFIYLLTVIFVFLSCSKDDTTDAGLDQQENALIQEYILKKGLTLEATRSGLYYANNTEGNGSSPGDNDFVIVTYNGYTLDDKLFDTTDSLLGSQNSIMPLNALYGPLRLSMKVNLPGWVETFRHMKEGGTSTAIMPSSLASLGDNKPRRYEFKLLKVITDIAQYEKQQITEYLQKTNAASLDSTSAGYYILSQTSGTGNSPSSGNIVDIQYTGRLLNGKIFEQTKTGINFSFVIGRKEILPALEDAVKQMKKGGKMTVLIPYNQAYNSSFMLNDWKQIVIPAYSSLIFEITLVNIR